MYGMRRHLVSLVLLSASLPAATFTRSPDPELRRAEDLYRRTEYKCVIHALQHLPVKGAAGYALVGKAYFMEGQFKEAAVNLESAVAEDSLNSDYQDWLGRSYGRLAEESSFISALKYARKTVRAFERAVDLDPRNLEALSDVFEYYLQAPGVVGGGMDKAENAARRIAALNQAEYHWARARIAQQRKAPADAEKEFRAALAADPNEVGRMLDLATFLCSRGRYGESDALFRSADERHPNSPKVLYAQAAADVQSKRKLEDAETLLERYLQLPATPEDPTRREVEKLMRSAQDLRARSRQGE